MKPAKRRHFEDHPSAREGEEAMKPIAKKGVPKRGSVGREKGDGSNYSD